MMILNTFYTAIAACLISFSTLYGVPPSSKSYLKTKNLSLVFQQTTHYYSNKTLLSYEYGETQKTEKIVSEGKESFDALNDFVFLYIIFASGSRDLKSGVLEYDKPVDFSLRHYQKIGFLLQKYVKLTKSTDKDSKKISDILNFLRNKYRIKLYYGNYDEGEEVLTQAPGTDLDQKISPKNVEKNFRWIESYLKKHPTTF